MDSFDVGELINVDGMTGFVSEIQLDDNGQLMGFSLRVGSSLHHYNVDLMMEDLEPVYPH